MSDISSQLMVGALPTFPRDATSGGIDFLGDRKASDSPLWIYGGSSLLTDVVLA